jgi:hypothetical protein
MVLLLMLKIVTKENKMIIQNSLDKILSAMRTGKYGTIIDTKGNVHIGLINSLVREDGSGKNWLVDMNNRTVTERVFIHAK